MKTKKEVEFLLCFFFLYGEKNPPISIIPSFIYKSLSTSPFIKGDTPTGKTSFPLLRKRGLGGDLTFYTFKI
ncbi:MAG: hypothetical protein CR971_01055 [candidate division SR1 bacterium]|nr:MAG: hypothetical protein CR971_01055 [candidate division SR1 bacterium]